MVASTGRHAPDLLPWSAHGWTGRVFAGPSEAMGALPAVHALREAYGLEADRMTDVGWFVSRTVAWRNHPIVVLLERDTRPAAAVLLYGRRQWGLPSGLVRGGNRSGDGVVIAPPALRVAALTAAAECMLANPWVHSVLASVRGEAPPSVSNFGFQARWRARTVATDLSLTGGFEGVLSRMRPRSRRNYRYFRRRAESQLGAAFVPGLTDTQAEDAVSMLHGGGLHPQPLSRALRLLAVARETPGYFAMGVHDASGQWLSYLSGWREGGRSFVEQQLNDPSMLAASLSTVMRTCLMEHEAATGADEIVFVGGSSDALGRYCAPDQCLDLLATQAGLRGTVATGLVTTLRPRGEVATMVREAVG